MKIKLLDLLRWEEVIIGTAFKALKSKVPAVQKAQDYIVKKATNIRVESRELSRKGQFFLSKTLFGKVTENDQGQTPVAVFAEEFKKVAFVPGKKGAFIALGLGMAAIAWVPDVKVKDYPEEDNVPQNETVSPGVLKTVPNNPFSSRGPQRFSAGEQQEFKTEKYLAACFDYPDRCIAVIFNSGAQSDGGVEVYSYKNDPWHGWNSLQHVNDALQAKELLSEFALSNARIPTYLASELPQPKGFSWQDWGFQKDTFIQRAFFSAIHDASASFGWDLGPVPDELSVFGDVNKNFFEERDPIVREGFRHAQFERLISTSAKVNVAVNGVPLEDYEQEEWYKALEALIDSVSSGTYGFDKNERQALNAPKMQQMIQIGIPMSVMLLISAYLFGNIHSVGVAAVRARRRGKTESQQHVLDI